MKVVYVDNYLCDLIIGETYDVAVADEYDYSYLIRDDNHIIGCYDKTYFKTLSEIRNEKIDKLLK
jgi:hypothetical protein